MHFDVDLRVDFVERGAADGFAICVVRELHVCAREHFGDMRLDNVERPRVGIAVRIGDVNIMLSCKSVSRPSKILTEFVMNTSLGGFENSLTQDISFPTRGRMLCNMQC